MRNPSDRTRRQSERGSKSAAADTTASPAPARTARRVKPGADKVPPGFEDVRLLDIKACCAPGDMGATWWRSEVAAGRAPEPVVRLPRCTRWRAADVHKFWADFAAGQEGAK
jgi:hypothetical protein